jgi:hypothetical protein
MTPRSPERIAQKEASMVQATGTDRRPARTVLAVLVLVGAASAASADDSTMRFGFWGGLGGASLKDVRDDFQERVDSASSGAASVTAETDLGFGGGAELGMNLSGPAGPPGAAGPWR